MGPKLNVAQAADYLGVCQSVVYALVAARELPHHRVGLPGKRGRIVLLQADCDAYLAGRRVEAGAKPAAPAPRPSVRLNHLHWPT